MATYNPESLRIQAPAGGFQQGGWYSGRQYWGGTLSDPGVIHPASDQQGSGQAVSQEVNLQSDQAQGLAPGTIENYLAQQRQQQQQTAPKPVQQTAPAPVKQSAPQQQPVQQQQQQQVPQNQEIELLGLGQDQNQSTINLPEIYKNLTKDSGISQLEQQYSEMEKSFIEAKGKSNNNPFLSEATRVGREAKLQKLFDERTSNIRGEIATKKADIETQLNLQMKQFDINSQQTQMAWEQFNTLLSMGALDNIGGEDIANITRSTGISSSMIQNAVQASKDAKVKTQMIQSEDDYGNVTVSLVDSNTGKIISQQNLGQIGTKTPSNNQVIQSEDASGNVTYSVIDQDTGQLVNQQSLGQIGTGRAPSAGDKEAKPGSSEFIAENKGLVSQYLSNNTNNYGHVSPADWNKALQAWLGDALGTRDEFIKNYMNLADTNRGDFKEQSGYGFNPLAYQ